MYSKLKYLILTILILGIGFGTCSYLKLFDYWFETEFYLLLILVGLIILYFFLPRKLKIKSKILTYSALGISLIFLMLTINLTLTHFSLKRENKIFSEYSSMNCEEIKKRFAMDKENNELKHFSGGFAGTGNLGKNLKKYDIQHFDLGCFVDEDLMCYSELVWEYLKEKENVEITQLYE